MVIILVIFDLHYLVNKKALIKEFISFYGAFIL